MEYLVLTNDRDEQEIIGKQIVADKSDIYSEKIIGFIRQNVVKNMQHRNDVLNIESEIYRSIYHYWMYGCTVDEYFYYEFYKKIQMKLKSILLFMKKYYT